MLARVISVTFISLLVVAGCVRVEASHSAATAETLELLATDWDGSAVDAQRLPRRPRLSLVSTQGFTASERAVLLFDGPPDADLVADLEREPLTMEHEARIIPTSLGFDSGIASIVPDAALTPNASFSLAVPGWVRTANGTALARDGKPNVFSLRTQLGPDAGARVVSSWPEADTVDVATNLRAAAIAFDGAIDGARNGVWLEGPDGLALPSDVIAGPCTSLAPEQHASFCVRIRPSTQLVPLASYAIVVGTETHDAHGAPVGPFRASFTSAAGPDSSPPATQSLACAVDERTTDVGCVLVDDTNVTLRVQATEPVIARLHDADDSHEAATLAQDAEAALRLTGFSPGARLALTLELTDAAGNDFAYPFALDTLSSLAQLSITEVRADALGPEPQQEYVELLNYSDAPIDLLGFSLDDRADERGDALPRPITVAPRARVLLVADGFDPSDVRDAMPPAGVPLVRVGRALAGTGLSNAGSALYLRDAEGRRVSAAPPSPRPRPGVCIVRTSTDMRDGEVGTFGYDEHETCTPGR